VYRLSDRQPKRPADGTAKSIVRAVGADADVRDVIIGDSAVVSTGGERELGIVSASADLAQFGGA
jgi:hypothetical protein